MLAIDGQALGGPQGKIGDKDAADALVLALETKWGWGPEVFKYLRIELEVETLHDFVAAFQTDRDWDELNAAVLELLQGFSRMRWPLWGLAGDSQKGWPCLEARVQSTKKAEQPSVQCTEALGAHSVPKIAHKLHARCFGASARIPRMLW